MGSLFGNTSPPPPPPPAPPVTYKDEVSGTEQIPVKNADGSYTYITRQIKTEEQKAQDAEYQAIMSDALAEVERLSANGFEHDASTKSLLDNWRTDQERFIDKTFDQREDAESAALARRGLTASSAGDAVNRQRMLDVQEAGRAIDRDENALSENIRQQRLSAQQNLYNIASSKIDLDAAKSYQSSVQGMNSVNAINNYNNNSLSDYYNRQAAYTQQKSQASNFGQRAVTSLILGSVAGPGAASAAWV